MCRSWRLFYALKTALSDAVDSILGLLKFVHDLFFSQRDLRQVEHLTHQHRLGCEVHHLHRGQLSQLAQVEEAIVHLLGDFYGLRVQ